MVKSLCDNTILVSLAPRYGSPEYAMKGGRLVVDGKNILVRTPTPPAPYHSVTGINLYGGGKDGDLVLVVDVNKGEGSPVRQCEVDVVVPELH